MRRSNFVDGVLVIDKPEGLTSHDVVAVARRALHERRIGHTGTLDPLATGVLPLACGRATRLVRFFASSDKDYEATIRFGVSTDSCDITGKETRRTDRIPERAAVEAAVASLRGEYLQVPPAFSAKKVAGERAYARARRDEVVTLQPAPVRVTRADLIELSGDTARISITCSAGFYVRTFAHSLGEIVTTGACLAALRRTRSGEFTIAQAIELDQIRQSSVVVTERWLPLDGLLPSMPSVRLGDEGRKRVAHGQMLGASHMVGAGGATRRPGAWTRIIDGQGRLVALGRVDETGELLHPAVVLI